MFEFCIYASKLTYDKAVLGEVTSEDKPAEYGTWYNELVMRWLLGRPRDISSLYSADIGVLKRFSRSISPALYCLLGH